MLLFIIIAILIQYILLYSIGHDRDDALTELFGNRYKLAYIPMWFWIDIVAQSIKYWFTGKLEDHD